MAVVVYSELLRRVLHVILVFHGALYLYGNVCCKRSLYTCATYISCVGCGVRYEAYGWHTQVVADGTDTAAIMAAIEAAKSETGKPSIIKTKTIIGYGSQKQVLFNSMLCF